MSTDRTTLVTPTKFGHGRINVLAFPSQTTTRFVVIIAAALASGLFVGDWFHTVLEGPRWYETIEGCRQLAGSTSTVSDAADQVARSGAAADCYAHVQVKRAVYAVSGACAVLAIGFGFVWLAPTWIQRRRKLQPMASKLPEAAAAVVELSERAGIRPPIPMFGSTTQRDAFSYGTFRHRRIALPRLVMARYRDASLFEPLVLHELAHIRNRDVGLAWLSRGALFGIVLLLAAPAAGSVLMQEFSLLPDYVWRAVALGVTVTLIAAALLRSREHDADLRAAQILTTPEHLSQLLRGARTEDSRPWRRLFAYHPPPAERTAVLAQPQRAAVVVFLDGFAPALLTSLTLPLLDEVATALATGHPLAKYQLLVSATIGGILLGATIGIGLWRQAFIDRACHHRRSPLVPAIGVSVGFLLGQVISLGHTSSALSGGLDQPVWLLVPAIASSGATVLVYSMADAWSETAPSISSASLAWVPGMVVASIIFGAALAVSNDLQIVFDSANWALVRSYVHELDSWPVRLAVIVCFTLSAASLVRRQHNPRHRRIAPTWILERSTDSSWPVDERQPRPILAGVVCGVCALGPYAVYRYVLTRTPGNDGLGVLEVTTWTGAIAGAAATVSFVAYLSRLGLAFSTVAGPVAIATFIVGFAAINAAGGATLEIDVLVGIGSATLALWFVAALVIAPVSLATAISPTNLTWVMASAAVLAATLSTATTVVVSAAPSITASDLTVRQPSTIDDGLAVREYLGSIATPTIDALSGAYARFNDLQTELDTLDPNVAVVHIESDIVTPLQELRDSIGLYNPSVERIDVVHASALDLLDTTIAAFDSLASGLRERDLQQVRIAAADLDQSFVLLDEWMEGVEELRTAGG